MPGRQRGADGLGSPSENTSVTRRWRQLCVPPGRAMGMNGTESESYQPLEGKMSLCGAEVGSQEGGEHDSGGGGKNMLGWKAGRQHVFGDARTSLGAPFSATLSAFIPLLYLWISRCFLRRLPATSSCSGLHRASVH